MYEKEGRETGARNKYSIYFRKRRRSRSLKLRPAAPRSRLVTTAFKMDCRRIVTLVCLSSFFLFTSPTNSTLPTHPHFPPLSYYSLYFHFIISWVFLLNLSALFFILFLICQSIDTRISSTRSPCFPLHGLLTPTRSGSSRLSRHNSSPLHKGSKLRI